MFKKVRSFDSLTWGYTQRQRLRLLRFMNALKPNYNVIRSGLVSPTEGSLPFGHGRRLIATVLYLDICSFSSRPSVTEEQQRDVLKAFSLLFPEMISIIEDYGGSVEKNTGDGLMAYFATVEGVADSKRALACGMTMFYVLDQFINPALVQRGLSPIAFRLCADRGFVTIARVGRKGGFGGFVAIGATANIASKMLKYAGERTFFVGDSLESAAPHEWKHHFKEQYIDWDWTDQTGQSYRAWEFEGRWTPPVAPRRGI